MTVILPTVTSSVKMWYEILPSFFIITGALALPSYAAYFMGWLVFGHPYRRCLDDRDQRRWYLRDIDRFGGPYNFVGLDEFFAQAGISDKECVCEDAEGGK